MNTFIGIKQLWYGDVLTAATNLTQANIATLVSGMTEVKNVHEDTWGYEESDPETTEYNNELTGQPYYIDNVKQGQPTISFTLGEYDYDEKADLQGGEVIKNGANDVGWKRPTELNTIYKCIVALSKTGVYIVFPKAQITAKGDVQEKNVGLGIQAKAVETGVNGLSTEYWIKSTGGTTLNHAFTAVEPAGSESPVGQGWYVLTDDGYVLTDDTEVANGTTYYVRS